MRRGLILGCSIAMAGCFYVDPVNQRPSLDIRPLSSDPVYRRDPIVLQAIASDPEHQVVDFGWRVFLCGDATSPTGCDDQPYYTGTQQEAAFIVPAYRGNPELPNESMKVVLDGTDARGAEAQPGQQLVIPVLNHPPELELRKVANHGVVVRTPIDLFAKFGDPDDRFDRVTLDWTAFSPSLVPDTLTPITVPQDPSDPEHHQTGMRLVPTVTGDWDIRVIATDHYGDRTEQHLLISVVDDTPPCLDTLLPIAPSGAQYPLVEPTLFQVAIARDDLDVYPPVPADPIMGTTRFEWSLKVGTGPRQLLATTGNSVAIDPASYAPETPLELRVQIYDRRNVPIACADADPTCAVSATNPSCVQRQTWRMEAR